MEDCKKTHGARYWHKRYRCEHERCKFYLHTSASPSTASTMRTAWTFTHAAHTVPPEHEMVFGLDKERSQRRHIMSHDNDKCSGREIHRPTTTRHRRLVETLAPGSTRELISFFFLNNCELNWSITWAMIDGPYYVLKNR